MVLVERGEIDLDADVNTYLTSYKVPTATNPLTVRDLMAHRPGLEDSIATFFKSTTDLPIADALKATEPTQVFPRGDRTAYSNWGSNLAALVIQDVTGRSYRDFLFDELLQPLGMDKTALNEGDVDPEVSPIARSYVIGAKGPRDAKQYDVGSFAPIGGMTSTADDMAKWVGFLLGEGSLGDTQIMSPDTFRLMRTRNFQDRPDGADMAHGFQDVPYRSTKTFGHGGSINDFLSNMMVAPELGIGIFISQNSAVSGTPVNTLPNLVFDRALAAEGALPLVAEIPEVPGDDAAAALEAAGTYVINRRMFSTAEAFFTAQTAIAFTADGPNLLIPGAAGAPLYRIAKDVWENRHGARFAFVRDDAGQIVRVADPSGTATWERTTATTDPVVLSVVLGIAGAFGITTWLGLWRRLGRRIDMGISGRLLSLVTLVATIPLFGFFVLMTALTQAIPTTYAQLATTYPPDEVFAAINAGSAVAITGALMVLSLAWAWIGSGWSIWRKFHHTFFAAAYGAAGYWLWQWGLAFSVPLGAG